jgi:phosphopantetheinyl transferase
MTVPSSADPFKVAVDLITSKREGASDRAEALVATHAAARRSRRGRPLVDGIRAFGVSHTGNWTAYLTANRKYVGVDLELRDRPDLCGMEARLGRAVAGGDEVKVDFLTRWVLKEACLKGVGLGLLPFLHQVRLKAGPRQDPERENGRMFSASVGRIGMSAMVFDIGFALLGVAYRDRYEAPSLEFFIDGCRQ